MSLLSHLAHPIHFTRLGLDPIALQIGPLALRWYSLAYIAGFFAGWAYLRALIGRPGAPMSKVQVDDFLTWAVLGVIGGGRLGYVLFYDPAQFMAHPLRIFQLWTGGMSFHGGLIGIIVVVAFWSRANRLDWLRVWDYLACVYPIGHFFGRLANFVNGELWGRPTNGSWGIIFPAGGPEPRHPSQLYEAGLEGLLLLAIMSWLFWRTNARWKRGRLVGVFALAMGLFRFLIEFVREPDRQLGMLDIGLTMGQTLTIPLVVIGLWLIVRSGGQTVTPEPTEG